MRTSLLRDWAFAFRYGFRGVPRSIAGYDVRVDESLRRWDLNSEGSMQKVLTELLQEGDVFVDVGANFGLHTLLGAKLVGVKGKVIAIEPVPSNLSLLRKNINLNQLNNVVDVMPCALMHRGQGEVEMDVEEGLSVAAVLSTSGKKTNKIKVQSSTLDECLADLKIAPKLIKIDVEGAEHEVLKGAKRSLSEHRPFLLIEVHSFALPDFGSSAELFTEFLRSFGYKEEKISAIKGVAGEYFHALFSPVNDPTSGV